MNAYEIPGSQFSLPTTSKIERYRFVAVDANGSAVQAKTAEDPIIGVSRNTPDGVNNQVADIADGIVMIEAAAAIKPGQFVTSDAAGKAVVGTKGAIALTGSSAAGTLITIKL